MNTRKIVVVLMLFGIALTGVVQAQAPDTLWTRTYGGTGNDFAYSVQQTSDGGYIIAGSIYSHFPTGQDFYLVKTDDMGDILWTRVFSAGEDEEAYSVIQTGDSGFVLAGYSGLWVGDMYSSDAFIVKTDSDGNSEWARTYTVPDGARCIMRNANGGYVVTGWGVWSVYIPGMGWCDFLSMEIAGINLAGILQWGQEHVCSGDYCGNYITGCTEGGYIIAAGRGNYSLEVWYSRVFKVDSVGIVQWERGYPGGMLWGVIEVEGGYAVAGVSREVGGMRDFYLVSTDFIGDTLWTRKYGGSAYEEAYSIQETVDSGYILAGYTVSYGAGGRDFYIVKTDSGGNVLWTKTVGGEGDEECRCIQKTSDGGYILAGYTNSYGVGGKDLYLVKLGPDTISSYAGQRNRYVNLEDFILHRPYPNPFNAVTTILYEIPVDGQVRVEVYDVLGREVATVADHRAQPGSYSVTWDAGELPSGIYFVRMEAGEFRQTRKGVLLK